MEDVHRAGGVFALLAELDRAGLLHTDLPTIHSATMKEAIDKWDIMNPDNLEARARYIAAPGGIRTTEAFSQSKEWPNLDVNRESGCIRSAQHAYSTDGGLAVRIQPDSRLTSRFGHYFDCEKACVVRTPPGAAI